MTDNLNLPAVGRRAPVDLSALGVRIREHLNAEVRALRACLERARESVEQARDAGELLKVARDQLKPQHRWHEWLEEQGISPQRANERIRIADNWSRLPPDTVNKGVERVLEYLRPRSPQRSGDLTEQLKPTLQSFGYTPAQGGTPPPAQGGTPPPARDEDEGLDEEDADADADADAGLNPSGPPPRTPSAVSPEAARGTPPSPAPSHQEQGASTAPPPPRKTPSNYSIPIPKFGGEPPPESPFERDRRLLAGVFQSLAKLPEEQGVEICREMLEGMFRFFDRLPEAQRSVFLACLDSLGRLKGSGPAGES
jgi:hypothetical protein